jgi:hypothetical protein
MDASIKRSKDAKMRKQQIIKWHMQTNGQSKGCQTAIYIFF